MAPLHGWQFCSTHIKKIAAAIFFLVVFFYTFIFFFYGFFLFYVFFLFYGFFYFMVFFILWFFLFYVFFILIKPRRTRYNRSIVFSGSNNNRRWRWRRRWRRRWLTHHCRLKVHRKFIGILFGCGGRFLLALALAPRLLIPAVLLALKFGAIFCGMARSGLFTIAARLRQQGRAHDFTVFARPVIDIMRSIQGLWFPSIFTHFTKGLASAAARARLAGARLARARLAAVRTHFIFSSLNVTIPLSMNKFSIFCKKKTLAAAPRKKHREKSTYNRFG